MVKPRSASRTSPVELKWKPVLDLIENSRLRRGKVMERQGQVVQIEIRDGSVQGTLQGPKMRSEAAVYQVVVPCTGWAVDTFAEVAGWLYERPDWLAALLANQWNDDFWDCLTDHGIKWYPTESDMEWWRAGCQCTCYDSLMPCTHAAAVVYTMLHEMEVDLFAVLRWIGLDDRALLDAVHQLAAVNGQQSEDSLASPADTIVVQDTADSNPATVGPYEAWSEEIVIYSASRSVNGAEKPEPVRHRIKPTWDKQKQTVWRTFYLWK